MTDPFDLERFVAAQSWNYSVVVSELAAGQKRTHWMWYVFPQVAGLGQSERAVRFAIRSLDEAIAYWSHPILGRRLDECTTLVLNIEDRTAEQIFGFPDDRKFGSCMTLFRAAVPNAPLFESALTKYFGGRPDQRTLQILGL